MTVISGSVSTVSALVDGTEIEMIEGSTVLDACRQAGADIPTLCYGPTMTAANACRVCVVEIEGSRTLVPGPSASSGSRGQKVAASRTFRSGR